MCLFVKDAVCIPTNVHANVTGPYAGYGFDVGVATVTPNLSSGQFSMQAMYESFERPGHSYILLASSPSLSNPMTYGPQDYKVPGRDVVTDTFVLFHPTWTATVSSGYPAGMLGSTVGGHSVAIPAGMQPSLCGTELIFFGFDINGGAPTAGFMVTFF